MGYWSPEARKAYRLRNAEKLREQTREYYRRNPEKRKETTMKTRARLDLVVYAAKDRPCLDCGNDFPSCAMQFDHVRGEKTMDVAMLRSRGNLQKLIDEIAKCDVVCANCHSVRTCLRDRRNKSRRCSHD